MEIRSIDPVWPKNGAEHFSRTKVLDTDREVEVAVVGAGISGALIAYELVKRGVEVAILDRAQPGAGSTAACTALIQYELDEPLISLSRIRSPEEAQKAYKISYEALGWLESHVGSLDQDCQFKKRKTLLLSTRRRDLGPMKEELQARQDLGIPAEWVDSVELRSRYGISRLGAIRSDFSIELDPYRLVVATLNRVTDLGASVYSPTEVGDYVFEDTTVSLRSTHGPQIRAKKVVVANGYQTPSFLRKGYGKLLSTWAVATRPMDLDKVWSDRQMIWEWGKPYLYARTTLDGRVIFGGADEPFTDPRARDALIQSKTRRLLKMMHKLMPELELEPEYEWSGTFAETEDAMPYIGSHPDYPNTWMALGYGGNGVTFSMIAARIITGMICDDPLFCSSSELFRFQR
ncbi:MAG: FAD-dependent oxidoreductase [Phycisphaerae bacterium]|nr:MAG: FAD-dependent oxidoreductase [Phycisphaerae bacterium]